MDEQRAQHAQQAGPEWAYCAALAKKNNTPVDLNDLHINVWHTSQPNKPQIDLILLLANDHVTNATTAVLRYSFDSFRKEYLGQGSDNFRVFFQAFHDAPFVEILDDRSFRRLLMAIQIMGLPTPEGYNDDEKKFYPPALRFVFGSQDFDPTTAQQPVQAHDPQIVAQNPKPPLRNPSEANSGPTNKPPVLPEPVVTAKGDGKTAGDDDEAADDDEDDTEAVGETYLLTETDDPAEELSLDVRGTELYNFGLSHDRSSIHNVKWHNLYADIAGISRDRCDSSNKEHEYQPPYSQIKLPPYQTYPVGWVLGDRERILHYLADVPGLGKTYTVIETMVRTMMIVSLGVAIEKERKILSTSSVRPSHVHNKYHPTFGKNSECRADTQTRYGVVCPCSPTSPTAALITPQDRGGDPVPPFAEGYMLVIVPGGLVDEWVRATRAFLRHDAVLPHSQQAIEIVDIGAQVDKEGQALQEFLWRRGSRRTQFGLGSICITANTVLNQSVSTYNKGGQNLSQQPCMIVCDEAHNIRSSKNLWPELMRDLVTDAPRPVHVLAISGSPIGDHGPEFAAIESISKLESLGTWFGEPTRTQYIKQLDRTRTRLLERTKEIGTSDPIRKCVKREQLSKDESDEALGLIRRYDRCGREYVNALPLLQRRAQDDYFGYRIPRLAPKSQPPQMLRTESVMNEDKKDFGRGFLRWLESCLSTRVKQWGNEARPTRGPRPTLADNLFTLETDAQVSAPRGVYDARRLDMSIVAFAPGVAGDMRQRRRGAFRVEEVNQVFNGTQLNTQRQAVMDSAWGNRGAESFEWNPRATTSSSSPKINSICAIINQMLADNDLHEGRDQNLGPLRKKAIICVPYAWHAYILMAFLFNEYPGKNFTYIGACFDKTERAALTEPFNRQTTVDDDKERDPNDPIALIGTYKYIAEGLNLTRCNYVISTSPMASRKFELQLFSRVVRRGQFCKTHITVLVDFGDPTDVVMFHRNRGHTPATVPVDDRGSGLRFLLGEEDVEQRKEDVEHREEGVEHTEKEVEDVMDVDPPEHGTEGEDVDIEGDDEYPYPP